MLYQLAAVLLINYIIATFDFCNYKANFTYPECGRYLSDNKNHYVISQSTLKYIDRSTGSLSNGCTINSIMPFGITQCPMTNTTFIAGGFMNQQIEYCQGSTYVGKTKINGVNTINDIAAVNGVAYATDMGINLKTVPWTNQAANVIKFYLANKSQEKLPVLNGIHPNGIEINHKGNGYIIVDYYSNMAAEQTLNGKFVKTQQLKFISTRCDGIQKAYGGYIINENSVSGSVIIWANNDFTKFIKIKEQKCSGIGVDQEKNIIICPVMTSNKVEFICIDPVALGIKEKPFKVDITGVIIFTCVVAGVSILIGIGLAIYKRRKQTKVNV